MTAQKGHLTMADALVRLARAHGVATSYTTDRGVQIGRAHV